MLCSGIRLDGRGLCWGRNQLGQVFQLGQKERKREKERKKEREKERENRLRASK